MQVDTPLVLDLAKYKWNKREADKYELSAVVEHVGAELSSGHYMAYIKEGLCWRLFSDQVIHKVCCCSQIACCHASLWGVASF